MLIKCLTTIPKGSRCKCTETERFSIIESVIWSNLHGDMQQFVRTGKVLRTLLNTMSADLFIGVPFNIASYALLTHLIAQQCQLAVGELVWTGGDVHLYSNHLEAVKLQLTRTPYPLPSLVIKRQPNSLFDYQFDDFEIINYQAHQHIKAPVAV